MAVSAAVRTASDDFLRVVLADPDLLDDAFARVMASWQAGPPPAPPLTRAAAGRPAGSRQPPDEAGDPHRLPRMPCGATSRPRVARSPPAPKVT